MFFIKIFQNELCTDLLLLFLDLFFYFINNCVKFLGFCKEPEENVLKFTKNLFRKPKD